MADDIKELHGKIASAIDRLDQIDPETGGEAEDIAVAPTIDADTLSALSKGLRASLLLADAALGECQKAIPYSPLHPVLKEGSDEIQWCCNHTPPHCAGGGRG
jgi:hypothetical protein